MKEAIFVIALGIVLWIIVFVFAIVMNADTNVLWICVIGAALAQLDFVTPLNVVEKVRFNSHQFGRQYRAKL